MGPASHEAAAGGASDQRLEALRMLPGGQVHIRGAGPLVAASELARYRLRRFTTVSRACMPFASWPSSEQKTR